MKKNVGQNFFHLQNHSHKKPNQDIQIPDLSPLKYMDYVGIDPDSSCYELRLDFHDNCLKEYSDNDKFIQLVEKHISLIIPAKIMDKLDFEYLDGHELEHDDDVTTVILATISGNKQEEKLEEELQEVESLLQDVMNSDNSAKMSK